MKHMEKEISTKKKIDSVAIQKDWCVYLLINCAFLFPVLLITKFPDQAFAIFSAMPEWLCMVILLPYWLPVIFYYVFRVMYLHFAVELGFLGFAVYRLTKEKNRRLFMMLVVLTILSTALNVYWLTHGRPYTIV